MLYYKIVDADNNLVGAETNTSLRYVVYQEKNDIGIITDNRQEANGLVLNGEIYHLSTLPDFPVGDYPTVYLKHATKAEYELIKETLENAAESAEPVSAEGIVIEEEKDTSTIEFCREEKIKEMSQECNKMITGGVDIVLTDGESHHFDLTVEDQINLLGIAAQAAKGGTSFPYHASGELCKFYSLTDINLIVSTAFAFKTYQTTYFNSLKNYIKSLDNIEDIIGVQYGDEIPQEYMTDVLDVLV